MGSYSTRCTLYCVVISSITVLSNAYLVVPLQLTVSQVILRSGSELEEIYDKGREISQTFRLLEGGHGSQTVTSGGGDG